MWSDSLLKQQSQGKLFILCAPAGTGKTTLLHKMLATFSLLKTTPSYTTRPQRKGEVDGQDYHFVSVEEFFKKKASGEFLETIELHGNYYGTSQKEIVSLLCGGNHVILAIDTRGARAWQKSFAPVLIFLKTSSFSSLKERLETRGSEDEKLMQTRLEWAKKELEEEKYFHYTVVNDSLEEAFSVLASIIVAETHKIQG